MNMFDLKSEESCKDCFFVFCEKELDEPCKTCKVPSKYADKIEKGSVPQISKYNFGNIETGRVGQHHAIQGSNGRSDKWFS